MKRLAAGAVVAVLLGACGSDGSDQDDLLGSRGISTSPLPPSTGFTALLSPNAGALPYPNDIYFAGSTDGTLNLPVSSFAPVTFRMPGSTVAEPVMNALDGFSTTEPASIRFDGPLAASSLTAANVRVLQVAIDPATRGATTIQRLLEPGLEYRAEIDPTSNSTLLITPVKPLLAKTSYLVIITNGVRDTTGRAASADADFNAISTAIRTELASRPSRSAPTPATCTALSDASLRPICQLTSTHFLAALALGVNLTDIVLTFSFTTQSINDSLVALNASATAGAYQLTDTTLTTAQLVPNIGFLGIARVYVGRLRVPYYLSAPSLQNPTAPLTQYWLADPAQNPAGIDPNSRLVTRFKPRPAPTTSLDIPLLLTIPTLGSPGPNGWPIVIFQHGTPRTRADALLVAESFAARGIATIAIDLPLHGITPDDVFASLRQPGLTERTFDLDLVNNQTLAPGPDNKVDDTGTHFINLNNVLVTRDNVRQATSDQIVLVRTIPTMDYDANGTPDFDPARIHFVGYSLGAIASVPLLGVNSEIRAASLPMGAGYLPRILQESSFYSGRINSALAAANPALVPGTVLYNTFFRDAQTAVDSADSINYAAQAVQLPTSAPRKIHMMYIVGGAPNPAGGNWPADTVVPVTRSQPLASALNLPVFTQSGPIAGNGAQVRLNAGIHNSYLDPRPAPAVTVEMQQQIAAFIFENGANVTISDPSVIAP
jgi:hypothetical protein